MTEPTNGQLRGEMLTALNLDERVRGVEIKQASTATELSGLKDELRSFKVDVLSAIEANRPKPIWPAVSALCGCMVVLMGIFAAIYGQA